jgi:predicted DNA-binding transcriptional regulator AlpA
MDTKGNDFPAHIDSIRLIRLAPLCELLGISPWTLRRWISTGQFPRPFRATAESPDMWRLRDIEAWVEKAKRRRLRKPLRGAALANKKAANRYDFEPTIEEVVAAILEAQTCFAARAA